MLSEILEQNKSTLNVYLITSFKTGLQMFLLHLCYFYAYALMLLSDLCSGDRSGKKDPPPLEVKSMFSNNYLYNISVFHPVLLSY